MCLYRTWNRRRKRENHDPTRHKFHERQIRAVQVYTDGDTDWKHKVFLDQMDKLPLFSAT